ncbi:MAG: hypothetical protein HY245_16265 [Rhizobiales bacterium]|nr:hypothetical protein [Hyphomicrobiales bacterium]MBI3674937.1 hypothetical protein [Hyphomicrobiales bacterium]
MDDRPQPRHGIASLALLGSFALALPGGSRAAVATKKNRALLAILALSPGLQATRQRLADLLWGDRAEAQARSSLRQSLTGLRRELGGTEAAILQTRDDTVALRPGAIAIDVADFLNLADSGEIAGLRRAASLYRGELLVDMAIHAPAFDDWLAGERQHLADRAILVLEKLSTMERGEARIEVAKRLVGLDNLREASHRALMLAYLEAGENGLALKQYETCRKLLKDELGAEPATATRDLRQRLSQGAATPPPATSHDPALDARPSIAVLPFADLSGDAAQDIFCEGLALNIVASLGRFHELFVIDRFSTLAYRGRPVTSAQAAGELAVRYILEGSVQKAGDRIRVSVQLVDGAENRQLWTETYDRQLTDIFAVQDEITGTIIGPLASGYGGRLGKAWRDKSQPGGLDSFVAMDHFRMGWMPLILPRRGWSASGNNWARQSFAIRDLPRLIAR